MSSFQPDVPGHDGLLRPRQTQAPGPDGGRLIADTFYDDRGLVTRKYDTYYATTAPGTTLFGIEDGIESQLAYDYDGLGRVTAEKFLTGNGLGTEKWRTTTSYGGDRVHVDPPAGGTPTTTITDAHGQTLEARQYKSDSPTGAYDAITYAYTPAGQLSKVTDSSGNTWEHTYDQRGRETQTSDPDKGVTKHTYDDLDRAVTSTDARNKTIYTAYDGLSRILETRDGTAAGTLLTQFVYDTIRKGQPTSSTRYAGGQAYTSTADIYDNLNRPTRTTVTVPSAEGTLAGSYQFNTVFNLDGTVQSTGYPAAGGLATEAVTYGYDSLARPTTVSSNLATYVTNTQYSLTGKVQQYEVGTTAGKKAWFTYTYEYGTQRLANSRAEREKQVGVDRSATYTYDPAGNVTSISDVSRLGTDTQCFTYDYLRRLSEAWADGNATCSAVPSSGVTGGVAPYWQSYTYDLTGNRTKETQHGVGGAADTTRTYAYPAPGQGQHRLTSVTQAGAAGARTDSFGYDATGNTTTRQIGTTQQAMTWDVEGRLEKVTEGSKVTSFLYDASGNRLIRRDGTTVTLYLPNGLELKKTTAVITTRYYSHGGQPIAIRTTSAVSFMAPDHQATAQVAINAATQNMSVRRYLPFGGVRASTGVWLGEKGFVGGTNDTSGLTHLGAREYDPAAGRFISVDPLMDLTDPQQIHGYTYASNNPVTFSDPTGLRPACDTPAECTNNAHDLTPGGALKPPVVHKPVSNSSTSGNRAPVSKPPTFASMPHGAYTPYNSQPAKVNFINGVGQGIMGLVGILGLPACDIFNCDYDRWVSENMPVDGDSIAGDMGEGAWVVGSTVATLGVGTAAKAATAIEEVGGALTPKALSAGRALAKDCNSFVGGTGILLADGTKKAIEKVKLGDKVLATDPETGETAPEEVTALITGQGTKKLVHITVDTDGERGTATATITATDGHPFWIPRLRKWLNAGELQPRMWLQASTGTQAQITAIRKRTAPYRVHNLTVDYFHTYYVLAGTMPILVHNSGSACPAWNSEFRGLARGDQGHVREVSTVEEMRTVFDRWTEGATRLPARGPKVPEVYKLSDGTVMQWRTASRSLGETIDIFPPTGNGLKVHLPRE